MTPSLKRLSAIGAIAGVLAFGGVAAAAGNDDSTDPTTLTEVVVDDANGLVAATDDGTETTIDDGSAPDDTVDDTVETEPEPGARPDGRGAGGGNCDEAASGTAAGEPSDSSSTEPTSDDVEVTVPQTDI